ncbi:MAG: hypothetical protein ABGZ35_05310 [Planctomycetaceae bacterium]
MKTFQDNAGRTWTVTVNVDGIKRVRSLVNINLLDVLDDGCKLLADLHDDPVLLVDVLYCLCRPDADRLSISDEEFGRAMAGDALLQAATALFESLSDFFPQARQRAAMKDLLAKTNTVVDRLLDHAETTLKEFDPASVAETAIASFGNSPASSAATPDP